jgi:hypothetical protein
LSVRRHGGEVLDAATEVWVRADPGFQEGSPDVLDDAGPRTQAPTGDVDVVVLHGLPGYVAVVDDRRADRAADWPPLYPTRGPSRSVQSIAAGQECVNSALPI